MNWLRRLVALTGLRQRQRHRQWVSFYRTFVAADDLVFDVGAHVGTRTAAFADLGARVVAVEPQVACVQELDKRFGKVDGITIVSAGLAAEAGDRLMYQSAESTLASMSPGFVESVHDSGRFEGVTWREGERVRTTTLDALIAEHGMPRFCKIDVEGLEAEVLAGLTSAIPIVSFEVVAERLDAAEECMARLGTLGAYRFNLVVGDTNRFHFERWVERDVVLEYLAGQPDALLWGDIYASLDA